LKPITHARKTMLLNYFDVLETQLRFALKDAAARGEAKDEAFVSLVAMQVQERLVDDEAGGASGPTFKQICKTLENVLDADFMPDAKGDPVKAVRLLKQQLKGQTEFTPPPGGIWRAAKGGAARYEAGPRAPKKSRKPEGKGGKPGRSGKPDKPGQSEKSGKPEQAVGVARAAKPEGARKPRKSTDAPRPGKSPRPAGRRKPG
jgi:hypothetical protein